MLTASCTVVPWSCRFGLALHDSGGGRKLRVSDGAANRRRLRQLWPETHEECVVMLPCASHSIPPRPRPSLLQSYSNTSQRLHLFFLLFVPESATMFTWRLFSGHRLGGVARGLDRSLRRPARLGGCVAAVAHRQWSVCSPASLPCAFLVLCGAPCLVPVPYLATVPPPQHLFFNLYQRPAQAANLASRCVWR